MDHRQPARTARTAQARPVGRLREDASTYHRGDAQAARHGALAVATLHVRPRAETILLIDPLKTGKESTLFLAAQFAPDDSARCDTLPRLLHAVLHGEMKKASIKTASGSDHMPHPHTFLYNQVLPGLNLSVSQAARHLRVSPQTLHRILHGAIAITPELAVGTLSQKIMKQSGALNER